MEYRNRALQRMRECSCKSRLIISFTCSHACTRIHTNKNCCESGVIAIDYPAKALLSSWESEEGEKESYPGKSSGSSESVLLLLSGKSARKTPSTSYPAGRIFRERRWLHIVCAGQTIYDSNDPGRNNWNRNERKRDLLRGLPFVPAAASVSNCARVGN